MRSDRLWIVAVVMALVLWPGAAHAQSEALTNAFRQGQAHYESGQYEKAIEFFRDAIALGEREFGTNHQNTVGMRGWLAEAYRFHGRYADAEPLYNQALAYYVTTLGPHHPVLHYDHRCQSHNRRI